MLHDLHYDLPNQTNAILTIHLTSQSYSILTNPSSSTEVNGISASTSITLAIDAGIASWVTVVGAEDGAACFSGIEAAIAAAIEVAIVLVCRCARCSFAVQ